MRENWISVKAAEAIAKKEVPQAEHGKMWILPGFYYASGVTGYRIRIYYDLTRYDLFLSAIDGEVLRKQESYIR